MVSNETALRTLVRGVLEGNNKECSSLGAINLKGFLSNQSSIIPSCLYAFSSHLINSLPETLVVLTNEFTVVGWSNKEGWEGFMGYFLFLTISFILSFNDGSIL